MNAELEKFVHRMVWSGFFDADQITREAVEGAADGQFSEEEFDADESKVRALVEQQFADKRKEELLWSETTDCDKLTKAFDELTAGGIVSLENAGYTISDGWADYQEVAATKPAGTVRGGCFYHGQDLERAVDGHGLYLTFGSSSGDDKDSLAIASEIVTVLRKHDLKPEWNGSIDQRIFLPMKWQRRHVHPETRDEKESDTGGFFGFFGRLFENLFSAGG